MRRPPSVLVAAVLAGTLALAGCGSDDPPSDPTTSAGASSAESPAPMDTDMSGPESSDEAGSTAGSDEASESLTFESVSSEPMTSEDGTDDSAATDETATDDAATDDAGTDDAATDDAGTDDAATGDAATGDAGTDDAGTGDAGTDDAGTDDAGATAAPAEFDDQTIAFFSGMCEGFAPFMGMKRPKVDPAGDFEPQRAAAVEYYQASATGAIGVADKIDSLPPPTIEGGEKFATAYSAAIRAAGEEAGKQVEIVGQTTDAASLDQAIDAAEDALNDKLESLGPEIQAVVTAPGVREAMKEIPACAAMVNG